MEDMMVKLPGDDGNKKDKLSELCDDVLIRILGLLDLKEAVRSSVLSRRWQHLCKYYLGCLSFEQIEPPMKRYDLQYDYLVKKVEVNRRRFEGSINKYLNSHQASTIDEFRVHLDLDEDSKIYVDESIGIALRKKVKKLQLDFEPALHGWGRRAYYCLTKETFSSGLTGIHFLTCLSFNFVGVSDEILEYILSSCPLLESLAVSRCALLRHPKVSAPRLKHLNICRSFIPATFEKSIEIYAPNLFSFQYFGDEIELDIKYAPKLNSLYYHHTSYYGIFPSTSTHLATYFSQLVTLSFGAYMVERLREFPKLTSLNHLRCEAYASRENTLRCLTSLIEAAPFLHKFELKLRSETSWVRKTEKSELREMWTRATVHPNKYIKEVEIAGFFGDVAHAEILTYLLKNAVMLETIRIDTCCVLTMRHHYVDWNRREFYWDTTRAMTHYMFNKLMQDRPRPQLSLDY